MLTPDMRLALRARCLIYGYEKMPECTRSMDREQGYMMNLERAFSGSCIVARGITVDKSSSVSANELAYEQSSLRHPSSAGSLPVSSVLLEAMRTLLVSTRMSNEAS